MEEKEVKKRRGYKDIKKQIEADKRYLENNPEAKERKKISAMKSNSKRFIKNYSSKADIEEFRELLNIREEELNKIR